MSCFCCCGVTFFSSFNVCRPMFPRALNHAAAMWACLLMVFGECTHLLDLFSIHLNLLWNTYKYIEKTFLWIFHTYLMLHKLRSIKLRFYCILFGVHHTIQVSFHFYPNRSRIFLQSQILSLNVAISFLNNKKYNRKIKVYSNSILPIYLIHAIF